jgi:hypothetical protein
LDAAHGEQMTTERGRGYADAAGGFLNSEVDAG